MLALYFVFGFLAAIVLVFFLPLASLKWEDYKKSGNKSDAVQSLAFALIFAFVVVVMILYYLYDKGLIWTP